MGTHAGFITKRGTHTYEARGRLPERSGDAVIHGGNASVEQPVSLFRENRKLLHGRADTRTDATLGQPAPDSCSAAVSAGPRVTRRLARSGKSVVNSAGSTAGVVRL